MNIAAGETVSPNTFLIVNGNEWIFLLIESENTVINLLLLKFFKDLKLFVDKID